MSENYTPDLFFESPGATNEEENLNENEYLEEDIQPQYIEIGAVLKICSINVEGLTKSKVEFLSKFCHVKNCDVLLLQETHTRDNVHLLNCGPISNFTCVDSIHHARHGISTFVKTSLCSDCSVVSKVYENQIAQLAIRLNEVTIVNIYKPPGVLWQGHLPTFAHPAIYMGDFNSHHHMWGYNEDDVNGEFITNWAIANDLHLKFDSKDLPTFHSGRWNRGYNPDLCFVSKDDRSNVLPATRMVHLRFPRSQHRCVTLEVGVKIPIIDSLPKPRWNFKKANWSGFSSAVDMNIRWIAPTVENYDRFTAMVLSSAKKFIPRGFRKIYIPNWNARCEELWTIYQETESSNIADLLIHELNLARTEKWTNLVERMDFSHSSREAWNLLKQIGESKISNNQGITSVHPNAVASRMVQNSKFPISKIRKKQIKNEYRRFNKNISDSPFGTAVTVEEVDIAILNLKPHKAAGVDDIFPELIIHFSKNARRWISNFFTDCYNKGKIPKTWNMAKVKAIPKPGKPINLPENYRPISLLCVLYKVFERIIYNRISSVIDEKIPLYQAGFRPGRSCCDQVLSLTTHIEAGFQDKKQTAVVFIDLSSAYDTVWKKGLLLKLSKVIKCRKTLNIISALLSNRKMEVHLGNKKSRIRNLKNGLPQGSVLAPILFNLYTSDIPGLKSRKFIYADDLAIAIQFRYDPKSTREAEKMLSSDLSVLVDYYEKWRLRVNPSKTEVSYFHLSNCNANEMLNVHMNGNLIKFNSAPTYLGVTLDRSLTFKFHCEKLSQKLKSRNNIIQKLSGTNWGATGQTLRISALSLVYSTAEYCAPVWDHSAHTHHIDTKLNSCMRIITGTIKSTPIPWLPILSNIAPPHIRRQNSLVREAIKIQNNDNLPIHVDLSNRDENRLVSRYPLWTKINKLGTLEEFSINEKWKDHLMNENFVNKNIIEDPSIQVPGFTEPRQRWVSINRIRTNHGVTNAELNKYDNNISPICDCGHPNQTVHHIYAECVNRRFDGDLLELHQLTDNAKIWLDNLDLNI